MCFEHCFDAKYTFFTYNDADNWARTWLTEDFIYVIQEEVLVFDPLQGRYL